MNITKFGHACLLVEEAGVRVLVDPGSWSQVPELTNVDAVLITHEHQDHVHIPTLQKVLTGNPHAKVITHQAVATLLGAEGITCEVIADGGATTVNGISIESFGHEHAVIYGTSPCQNTGFLIAEKLFIPGDALHDVPTKPVAILALPTGGPWMKMAEAIDYAKKIMPSVVFPIHDAMYTEEFRTGLTPRVVGGNLEPAGISFRNLSLGKAEAF